MVAAAYDTVISVNGQCVAISRNIAIDVYERIFLSAGARD